MAPAIRLGDMTMQRFKKDKTLDAKLRIAASDFDSFVQIGIENGMTAADLEARAAWYLKQSRQYRHSVDMEIGRLNQAKIMESLGS